MSRLLFLARLLCGTVALLSAIGLLCPISNGQTSPIPGNTTKTGWQIACPPGMGTIRSELSATNPGLYIDALCVDNTGAVDGGFPAVEYFYSPPINMYVTIGGGSGGGGTVTQCAGSLIRNALTKGTGPNQICSGSPIDDGTDPVYTAVGWSSETGGFWDSYTVGTGGVTAGLTVCEGSSSNTVITCAAGATSGLIGVAQTTVGVGGQVRVCFVGHCNATEDSTIVTQDWSVMSPTVAGELTDSGINVSQPCPAGQQALYTQSGNTGAGTVVGVDFLTANDTCKNNGSGTIVPASQFATAYYSAPGTGIQISGIGPNTSALAEVWTQANGTAPFWGPLGVPVDNVTATSYTGLCTDNGRHKVFSAGTSVAATLPTSNTCTGPPQPNFITLFSATGTGSVVITPTAGTIGKIGGTQGSSLTLASGSSGFIYTDSVSTGCTVTACYDVIVDASTGGGGTVTQDTTSVPELLINGTNHVIGSSFTWTKQTEPANTIWAGPPVAALPNFVQVSNVNYCLGSAGQNTCATTFPNKISANDAVMLIEGTGNTSTMTAGGATDSLGNSYSVAGTFSQTHPNIFVNCNSAAGSDTVTFTASTGGAPWIHVVAIEVSGNLATSANACIDANGNSSSSLTVGSGSVSQATEFVFATIQDEDTTNPAVLWTQGAGYTQIRQYHCDASTSCAASSAHDSIAIVGQNANTGLSGAQSTTFTVSGSTTNISADIVTIKLTSASGIPTFRGEVWADLPVTTLTPTNLDCLNVSAVLGVYQIQDSGAPCGGGTITLTGDVTGSGTSTIATTLANSGVTAGSCGDSTHSCGLTINSKGLITVQSNNAISGSGGGAVAPVGSLVAYSGAALTLTSTTFVPFGGGGTSSTTEANVDTSSPQAATVSNLYVQISAAPGAGNSFAFTARNGASSQVLTCTISGASATSCNDTTHNFAVATADLLDWQIVPTGTIVVTPNVIITAQWAVRGLNSAGTVLLEEHTASSSTALQFTTCISSNYDEYKIELVNIIPATNNTSTELLYSTNGGSSYDNTAGHYAWNEYPIPVTGTPTTSGSDSAAALILVSGATPNSTSQSLNGSYTIYNPGSTIFKALTGTGTVFNSPDSHYYTLINSGQYLQTTAANAFEIIMASGNITSGTVRCYGVAK